jgi:hypothetical protein
MSKMPVPGTLVDADQYFKHGHDDTSSGTPVTEEDTVDNDIMNRLLNAAGELFPGSYISFDGPLMVEAADEIARLSAVVDALRARPFRGTSAERRHRMYGSDWDAVHDALDFYEESQSGK